MRPHVERDPELLQQGEINNDSEQYHKVMSQMENFLDNPTPNFTIPPFEPKNADIQNSNANDFDKRRTSFEELNPTLAQMISDSVSEYSSLRDKCYLKIKEQIDPNELKNNENLRILIIVPSQIKQKLSEIKHPDNIEYYFIENYEVFATAFLLRHLFHFQYFIDYEHILITSSQDDNFSIFNLSAGYGAQQDRESSKPFLSFSSKMESRALSSEFLDQFNVPPSLSYIQPYMLCQVLDNLITFQHDGLMQYNVYPFNESFLKTLNSDQDSNLLVFFIDHGTNSGFGNEHSFDYFLKGIEKIQAKNYFFFIDSFGSSSFIHLFELPEQILKGFNNFDCLKQKYPEDKINIIKLETGIFETIVKTKTNSGIQDKNDILQNLLKQLKTLNYTKEEKAQITLLFQNNPSFFNSKVYSNILAFETFSELDVFHRFSTTKDFKVFASSFRKSFPTPCYVPKINKRRICLENFFGSFYMSIIIQVLFFDPPSKFTDKSFNEQIKKYATFLRNNFQSLARKKFVGTKIENEEVDEFFEQLGRSKLTYSNSVNKGSFWFQPYISKVKHAIEISHIPKNHYRSLPEHKKQIPNKPSISGSSSDETSDDESKPFFSYFQKNANHVLHKNGFEAEYDPYNLHELRHRDGYFWIRLFRGRLPYFPDLPWSKLVDLAAASTVNYITDNHLEDKCYSVIYHISNAFAKTKKQHPNVNSFTFLCE